MAATSTSRLPNTSIRHRASIAGPASTASLYLDGQETQRRRAGPGPRRRRPIQAHPTDRLRAARLEGDLRIHQAREGHHEHRAHHVHRVSRGPSASPTQARGPRAGSARVRWFETLLGSMTDALVKVQGGAHQRFREFGRRLLGSESSRTPRMAGGRRLRRSGAAGPRLARADQSDHGPDAAGAGYPGGDPFPAAHGWEAGACR